MKITFVMPGYSLKPVGGIKVVYDYANQLASRGHEVTVLHSHRWSTKTDKIRHPYLWLISKIRRPADSVTIAEVNWYPIDSRVKMFCIPEPTAKYVPNGDVLFWYDKGLPPEKGMQLIFLQGYGVFPRALEDAGFRAPMPKIVIARWLYEQGLKLGVPPDEMVYIPNGFDHSRYRIVHPIERRSPRIAMLYHPLPLKGAEDGIRALELARRKLPALQAALFGVFPRPGTLPGWIEYYHDPTQEDLINSVYNGSSIYLCPSWTEGFHLPPGEAMACGCALVSTDIGGVRDYAEHEVTALLSPPKNPEALAQNIVRLLEDDELRIRIAKAGHQRIQEFNWERSTDLLEQFLKDIIGRRSLQEKR